MTEKLKPCDCGGNGFIPSSCTYYWVECDCVGCVKRIAPMDSVEAAIAAWNRRTEPAGSAEPSDEQLAKLKKLAEAATPGPWDYDTQDTPYRIAGGEVVGGDCTGFGEVYTAYDCPNFSDELDAISEPMTLARDVSLNNGRFIRAVNPQVILTLIDCIEEMKRKIAQSAGSAGKVGELPPLPEPWQGFQFNGGWKTWEQVVRGAIGETGVTSAYTADQMREYALAAIASAAPSAQTGAQEREALMVARAAIAGVVNHPDASQKDKDKSLGVALNAIDEIEQLLAESSQTVAAPAQLSEEPDQALLISMACCLNHGFGLDSKDRQEQQLYDMRKLYDEMAGRGYYKPTNRERYLSMLSEAQGKESE